MRSRAGTVSRIAVATKGGLTRPNGFLLGLALGILALEPLRRRDPGWVRQTAARLLTAAMPVVGLLLYVAFVHLLTGNPFAWLEAHAAWGREFGATARHYGSVWQTITGEGLLAYVQAEPARRQAK